MQPKVHFEAVPGSRLTNEDAALLGPELYRLAEQYGGLTGEIILQHGTPKRSVLHRYLPWDDVKAAHRYRLLQARNLARSIVVVFQTKERGRTVEKRVKALQLVVQMIDKHGNITPAKPAPEGPDLIRPKGSTRRRAYVKISTAVSEPDYVQQMITAALRDLQSFQARYDTALREYPKFREKFADVWAVIERIGRRFGDTG